jgi:hypothetical protein
MQYEWKITFCAQLSMLWDNTVDSWTEQQPAREPSSHWQLLEEGK